MASETKFVRGSNSINLSVSPFTTGAGFAPPAVNRENNITSGTSANVSGGGSLVSYVDHDRDFSFQVRIDATCYDDAHALMRKISSFVERKSSDTLYLEYRTNSSIPVPLWGQFGAPLRYEVVTAHVSEPDNLYSDSRGVKFFVTITLEIKPLAVGNKQKLINAMGGIVEDNYGTVDGTSRGLGLFETTVNKINNPVFGNATFDNGWTTDATIITTKNTDPAFCLPGVAQSVKIVATGTGGIFYETRAGGSTAKHSFSAYIMTPSGIAPTTADLNFYYNADFAASFTNLGKGLYCAYADNVTGIAAAVATGIVCKATRAFYLLGFQMEQKTVHTQLAYGDLLGCSWATTAHASATTRANPVLSGPRTDDYLSLAQGAIEFVYQPYNNNNIWGAEYFFSCWKTDYSVNSLMGFFQTADNKFYLTDGTNTISSSATTWTAGDILRLVFSWGPSGLAVYRNGASIASGATYTPPLPVNAATLCIGRANPTIGNIQGEILGFDVYDEEMSSATVTALDAAISSIINAGGRVSSIPWLWTKDGDGVVDNCDDATHDNWAVAGGITGSAQARTIFDLRLSGNLYQLGDLYISVFPSAMFINPGIFYLEDAGTDADAGSSAGYYKTLSLANGASETRQSGGSFTKNVVNTLIGKEFYSFFRLKDAAANTLSIYNGFGVGISGLNYSIARNVTASASVFTLFRSNANIVPPLSYSEPDFLSYLLYGLILCTVTRVSGGTVNLLYDFMTSLFRPLMRISTVAGTDGWIIEGQNVTNYDVSGPTILGLAKSVFGDVLELEPGKFNQITSLIGSDTIECLISTTITYNSIIIYPRYTLA
jgi:hypothetical protein